MRISLNRGPADFDVHDNTFPSADVAIVNEAHGPAAYWPKTSRNRSQRHRGQASLAASSGIVSDYAYHNPADTDAPSPVLYLPLAQRNFGLRAMQSLRYARVRRRRRLLPNYARP